MTVTIGPRRLWAAVGLAVTLAVAACGAPPGGEQAVQGEVVQPAGPPPAGLAVATFAGGCFWCMEPPFDALPGVVSTTSGYTGGWIVQPSYQDVTGGNSGHLEAVRVVYDPARVTYARLLEVFWRNVDPLDAEGQFCDRGESYTTAVFAHDAEQRRLAEASKAALAAEGRLRRPIVTPVRDAGPFWAAEEYHQDYSTKNAARYRFYRENCGRDARLREVWGG